MSCPYYHERCKVELPPVSQANICENRVMYVHCQRYWELTREIPLEDRFPDTQFDFNKFGMGFKIEGS